MKSFHTSVFAASVSTMVVAAPPALAQNGSAVALGLTLSRASADWFILDASGRIFNLALPVPQNIRKPLDQKSGLIAGRLTPRQGKVDPCLSFTATGVDPFRPIDRVTPTSAN